MAKRFGFKVKNISKVDDISWLDILTRRIKVLSVPSKELVTNLNEKWKRRAIKWLWLDTRDEIFIYWMHSLFETDYGDNVLFVDGAHIAEMYSSHLPHFRVSVISNSTCSSKVRRIFECCFAANILNADNKFGVTVFTNTISEWIIKKYRFLHPNRKIILRFHDLLEQAGGGKAPREEVLFRVNRMIKKGVIDEVESYSFEDAKDLGGIYRPNGVNSEFLNQFKYLFREKLICFVGAMNSCSGNFPISRESALQLLMHEIIKIYPNAEKMCITKLPDFKKNYWMAYGDFVKIYALSEVYVDLMRIDSKEGFSFRISEALWLNRKIISNRLSLSEEIFYSPERIFLIGYDPIERLRSFLETDLKPLPKSVLNYYDSRLWWTSSDPYRLRFRR